MRKFILGFILFLLVLYISPVGGALNYSYAKMLYDNKKYEESIEWFERALKNSPQNATTRFYYVLALSKLKPTYSVQQKIYQLSTFKKDDEATKLAKSKAVQLRQKLLVNLENNYIYNAPTSQGVLRWDIKSFPLKVYIDPIPGLPPYYVENIKKAFNLWMDNTNFIKFDFVNNQRGANILVFFNEATKNDCKEGEICVFKVAYTNSNISANGVLNNMTITFNTKNLHGKPFLDSEIYQTAIHEIGHALGISGHSDDQRDVMYSNNENVASFNHLGGDFLTERDLKTMILLYRLQPTITNMKNLSSETFYYAPLIIGSEEEVLQMKLKECRQYIDDYPELITGYINMAGVLIGAEKYDEALKYIDRAQKRAQTQEDFYSVELQRAYVYWNKKEYSKSLEYAQKAQKHKDTDEINEFINQVKQVPSGK